jgi:hypothetical protein
MDVAIDTSSLSNVTEADLVQDLVSSVIRCRARLVISGEALAECLDSNEDGARRRLSVVLRIADALGTRLLLADELGSIHRRERQRAITSTPKLSGSHLALGFLRDSAVAHDWSAIRASTSRYLHKGTSLDVDRAIRAVEELTPQILVAMIAHIRDHFWSSLFVQAVSENGRYAARMRACPGRYRSAITLAAYSFLNGLGAATPGHFGKGDLVQKPRWGNWVDARIAAAGAYCTVMVTDDRLMRNKVNFIGEHFGFRCRAIDLDSWLKAKDRNGLRPEA